MTARAKKRIDSLHTMMARKPIEHGKRVSYILGCRCLPCRAANANYSTERALRKVQGKADPLVASTQAREHILQLSVLGIGRNRVAQASGVNRTIIVEIRSGSRPNIRLSTERKILAVDTEARAGHSLVDAASTWHILRALIREGYTKSQLATWLLGRPTRALQIGKRLICTSTARAVEHLSARIERGEMQRSR